MIRSTPTRRAALLALTPFLLLLFLPAAAAADKPLFELRDARGDDHGNGNLEYPLRHEFEHGDLDLIAFRAFAESDGTRFEVELARKIRKPERGAIDALGTDLTSIARHGFYTFNIDVYIDKDRIPGSGGVSMLPGRHAEVRSEDAWDRAVVVTPRPNLVRTNLRRMWTKQLNEAMRDEVDGPELDRLDDSGFERERARQVSSTLAESVYLPQQIRVRGRVISFFVPSDFLGGIASADWAYVVAITGSDLVSSFDLAAGAGLADAVSDDLMAIQISPGTWQDRFGGGREESPNQPPIVDIFAPEGRSQERILSEFTSRGEDPMPVRLPGLVPSEMASGSK